jgi:hypothetical protein
MPGHAPGKPIIYHERPADAKPPGQSSGRLEVVAHIGASRAIQTTSRKPSSVTDTLLRIRRGANQLPHSQILGILAQTGAAIRVGVGTLE